MGPSLSPIGFNINDHTVLRTASKAGKEESGLPSDTFAASGGVRVEPKSADAVAGPEGYLERPGQPSGELPAKTGPSSAPLTLIQEPLAAVEETAPAAPAQTLAEIAKEVAGEVDDPSPSIGQLKPKVEVKPEPVSQSRKAGLASRIGQGFLDFVTSDPIDAFRPEMEHINGLEPMAKALSAPGDFSARQAEIQKQLDGGGNLAAVVGDSLAKVDKDLLLPEKFQEVMTGFTERLAQGEALGKVLGELDQMTPNIRFTAKTEHFRRRLEAGETLEQIRPEAYAVAREAARITTKTPKIIDGMRAYDCQLLGALTLDNGPFAEMKTGEGKTLAAVLPLYLNGLTGKGAHLVTVNDRLADRDSKKMGPAFEMLGLTVGTVLENMSPEQKRAGYNADITYTTDRNIGFDFLRDQTAKSPSARVQRGFHFAIIDEVDEVLIDEARTPLIISGMGEPAEDEYKVFNEIAKTLVPGKDYYTDPEHYSVWLTDTGGQWVENQLQLLEIDRQMGEAKSPLQQAELKIQKERCLEYGKAIRAEQDAYGAFVKADEAKPGFFKRLFGAKFDKAGYKKLEQAHEEAQARTDEAAARTPLYELYSEDNSHRVRYMQASLKAHSMFGRDKEYMVAPDAKRLETEKKRLLDAVGPNITDEQMALVEAEATRRAMAVQIVDENKGRTSDGRRYNDGIHQALEAKEYVPIQNEQRTIASVTYPNLFKKYERWSGMSGTCKTSEGEFVKLYDKPVSVVPTNKPIIREDQLDVMFLTAEEKYRAVARDAANDFFEGKPVLIGTLSVEHNLYMANMLFYAGVPWEAIQVLNAETVRGDRAAENEMMSNAGRSGVVTVATNMAGRGADIQPDFVNFKKLSLLTSEALQQNKPVVVELRKQHEAEWMAEWLSAAEPKIVDSQSKEMPGPGQVLIRVVGKDEESGPAPQGGLLLKGEDYPTDGLAAFLTERANSPRIDNQFKGRSGRQGAPGRTRVYLSMKDDLLQVYGGMQRELLESLIPAAGGVADSRLDQLNLTMNQIADASSQGATPEQVDMLKKRATVGFLGDALTGKEETDMGQLIHNVLTDAVWKQIEGELPTEGAIGLDQLQKAVTGAEQKLGLSLAGPTLASAQADKLDSESAKALLGAHLGNGLQQQFQGLDATIETAKDRVEKHQDLADGVTDEAVNALPADTQKFLGWVREEMLAVRMVPGEGLSDPRLHKLVDNTQRKVEEAHFSARENTNKKDETLNLQREAFYKFREEVLNSEGNELRTRFSDMVGDAITQMVFDELPDKKRVSYGQIREAVKKAEEELNIPIKLPFLEHKENPDSTKISAEDLDLELRDYAQRTTSKAVNTMATVVENVDSPLRGELLDIADESWSEHLEDMSALQQGIHWMAVAQKDPEVEFKLQAFDTFKRMSLRMKHRTASEFLPKLLVWSQEVENRQQQATAS